MSLNEKDVTSSTLLAAPHLQRPYRNRCAVTADAKIVSLWRHSPGLHAWACFAVWGFPLQIQKYLQNGDMFDHPSGAQVISHFKAEEHLWWNNTALLRRPEQIIPKKPLDPWYWVKSPTPNMQLTSKVSIVWGSVRTFILFLFYFFVTAALWGTQSPFPSALQGASITGAPDAWFMQNNQKWSTFDWTVRKYQPPDLLRWDPLALPP